MKLGVQPQQGFTLLEVLIALAILSFGLLGFAEALLIATEQDRLAYLQSQAVNQTLAMAERLLACQEGEAIVPGCLSQEIAQWQQENSHFFPEVESKVTAAGNQFQISISWQMPFRTLKMASKRFSYQETLHL